MAFKVLTVVGARPQFIKAAVVSHALEANNTIDQVLIHTGQHYDYNMSQAFFDELNIPEPKVNLGISGGSHAQMTARMMIALEQVMLEEQPDAVLLYGDTNSTLAAALVAAKLHVPVAHVEAGTRTRSMTNPEEINRICTDHVSSLLMACTEANLDNLVNEGLADKACFVGDPMYDAFQEYRSIAAKPKLEPLFEDIELEAPDAFYYLTCHREENTADESALVGILDAMEKLDAPVIYPVHPRNTQVVRDVAVRVGYKNIMFVKPVGYLGSVYLVSHAVQVVTDSGGLQREAFFAGVKCTTVLPFEVWPETMVGNRNLLASPDADSIIQVMGEPQHIDPAYMPFGNGMARFGIVEELKQMLERG